MTSPFGPLRLIVNPRAGRGAVGAHLPDLLAELRRRGLEHEVATTTGPGAAMREARRALDEGIRYLCAVGGDGTVHEVVNGMVDLAGDAPRPVAPDAVLAVSASGSGCDFIRTFGLDRRAEVLGPFLASEHLMPIDLGLLSCTGADGRPHRVVFANIAEAGYGAEAVARAARLPRRLGRVRYLIGAYQAILAVDRQESDVEVAHTTTRLGVVNLVVANCQFFGGGMKVAPRALPDDGLMNVQIYSGPRSQVFTLTPKIYRGEHVPHPNISEYQSPTVRFAPARPVRVEADGEVLGRTPVEISTLEKIIQLKV